MHSKLLLIGLALWLGILDLKASSTDQRDTQDKDEICMPLYNRGCDKFYEVNEPSPLPVNHSCMDYSRRQRGDESAVLSLIEKDLVQKPDVWNKIIGAQKFFYHIKGNKPGEEFLFCTVTKTGSTRLRMLLMRIQGMRGKMMNRDMWFPTFIQLQSTEEKMRLLRDPNVARIRMVRNPYIRASSMYLSSHSIRYVTNPPSFDDWIAQLHYNKTHGGRVRTYHIPQKEFCWENVGLQFDYIVKVERQNYWFPCFVEEFNLWRYVMRGWNSSEQCYLSTPDVPCNGPWQNEEGRLVYPGEEKFKDVQSGREAKFSDGVHATHNSNAADKFKQLYKNESTALKVTELFLDDIVHYNYPYYSQIL